LFAAWVCAVTLAGCANCAGDEERGNKRRPEIDPAKRLHAEVEARLADRKIDLNKAYPKDEKGQVDCGQDATCFIAMAQRCEPALFKHEQVNPGYVFVEHSEAIYRVAGKQPDGCAIQRARVKVEQRLPDEIRATLAKSGKDEAWIARQHDEALLAALKSNPRRLECVLPRDNALDLALDIADKRHMPGHFNQPGCNQPPEDEKWPNELKVPEGAAEGAALAQPDASTTK
jgi:hypothetical protein